MEPNCGHFSPTATVLHEGRVVVASWSIPHVRERINSLGLSVAVVCTVVDYSADGSAIETRVYPLR